MLIKIINPTKTQLDKEFKNEILRVTRDDYAGKKFYGQLIENSILWTIHENITYYCKYDCAEILKYE